jgi:hypothetical protein
MKSHLLLAATMLALLAPMPNGQTQVFYDPFAPQQPALTGPTPGATLRNAVSATQNQATIVRKAAGDWARRAGAANYNATFFQQDFGNMQAQFQALRVQFNWTATQAQQLGKSRAQNAVAELDAGLNIIGELFTFLTNQYNAGALDRNTIVRTARAFEDSMQEWEREFRKNSARVGLAW